jgi:hypothetical protein
VEGDTSEKGYNQILDVIERIDMTIPTELVTILSKSNLSREIFKKIGE